MALTQKARDASETFGSQLQYWRRARSLSQLALATQAQISSRHLCFIETGRAQPSRDMILRLSSALDIPLRAQNALLLAAGFAPVFNESKLGAPELAVVEQALAAILAQQEPYPAVVLDRVWNISHQNRAAERFFTWLLEGRTTSGPPNVLRLIFHPKALKPLVANWPEVAQTLLQRARREAVGGVPDRELLTLLDEITSYEKLPARWHSEEPARSPLPIVPVRFAKEGRTFSYFSTVTVLGTPEDVTAQELRIECFFPADEATRRAASP